MSVVLNARLAKQFTPAAKRHRLEIKLWRLRLRWNFWWRRGELGDAERVMTLIRSAYARLDALETAT
jgi:hypothetical protein